MITKYDKLATDKARQYQVTEGDVCWITKYEKKITKYNTNYKAKQGW